MGMRRPDQHEPGRTVESAVVAVEAFADQQAVVLEALLRARRAKARRGRIKLDLQSMAREEVAEREGFEPPVPQAVQQISSLPHSTTLPSLRGSGILSG